jgi:hypothetical protein
MCDRLVFRRMSLALVLLLCACADRGAVKTHVITWTEHQRIRRGMPYAEAASILGQAGTPSVEYDPDGRSHHNITFDSPSGVFMVQFDAGRVAKVYPGTLQPPAVRRPPAE